jgi:shikimate kinase
MPGPSTSRCADRMPCVVVLVGMMGSGKTTVGRKLAARIGARFVDTDDLVVAGAGRSVRDIFERDGEAEFRRLETAALNDALTSTSDTVVAAAGGCVLSADNRAAIAKHARVTVWLDADAATLGRRTARGGHRPLIDGDPVGRLTVLDRERRSLYEALADVRIDTAEKNVDEVVTAAARAIQDVVAS